MDNKAIRNKAFTGTVWKFLERLIAQGVSLVVSIIIARCLSPDEYSIVSIVIIFFAFADVFISGGFNTALIQKKEADIYDYSSVLIISVFISIICYMILFISSPFLAKMYNKPILVSVIRVMSLVLPVNALKSILCAYISSKLEFRKFFFATIGGTIISGVIGVYLAFTGYGAWALVIQQMANSIIDTIILFFSTKIKFVIFLSINRIKVLFTYGWKIFITNLLITLYSHITPIIIGIKFNAENLSFYTKGQSFPSLVSSTCTNTLSAVLFPVLAKCQDDKILLLQYTRKFINLSSFIIFPTMLGLFSIAENMVMLLLTEKWIEIVPYIRVFCIAYMFDVIHVGNCETIKAMGRSDVYLKMEIIKKTCYFIIIAFFVVYSKSPLVLSFSAILCTVVAILVNSIPNVILINYSLFYQIKDMALNLVSAIIMCIIVLLFGKIHINFVYKLLIQLFVGVSVYWFIAIITQNKNYRYILNIISEMIKRNKNE